MWHQALAVLALEALIRFASQVLLCTLLDDMFFLCVYIAVGLIDRRALAADARGHATNYRCLHHALVVVHAPNAVIISVANEDFYVATRLVVER